jgi:hypothetical protein
MLDGSVGITEQEQCVLVRLRLCWFISPVAAVMAANHFHRWIDLGRYRE